MDIQLLGPVEASVEGRVVAVGPGKQRALLAMLALRAGSTVSSERLIDGLWDDPPPATAAKLVQLHVSHLRKALASSGEDAEIVTRGRGYELRLGSGEVDCRRFDALVASGRPRDALALWRGPALDDVAGEPFAAGEINRLEESRLTAVELAVEADLEAGRHREVVSELEALVLEEPLRERLQAQRMLALYRCGRQADALAAYRTAREALVEAIGVEPGPELRRLHEAILRQDPSLESPIADPRSARAATGADTPLVGRDGELARLRALWRRARRGTGRLVVVAGPPGIGKTRLAAELAAQVGRDGGAVLHAAGPPERALTRARAVSRPTLLVLDDLDESGELLAGLDHQALAELPLLVVAIVRAPVAVAATTLTLAPLGRQAAEEIARLHLTAHEPDGIPVAELLAASGGNPGRLHRAAAQCARAAAARRIAEAAVRLEAERPLLRAAEDDLAGDIVGLQALREHADVVRGAAGGLVVCPFKGLAPFEVQDADVFFGRERLVADLVARLTGSPLIAIVGASGSGKSSLLRAGLLAALAAGVLPGSERWALAVLRPGEHPLDALGHATAGLPSDGRLVIAVDQFEEVFTACRDEAERAAFVDALVASTRDPARPALVLIAVRADFYERCAAHPELARLLGANHVLVGPMRRDELRRAIEGPANHVGLRVSADLTDALVADVEGGSGALPLLSTSLVELWQHCDGRSLDVTAYARSGGVHGAVARLAERAYERLEPDRRPLARRVLLRLADDDGDLVVRRRISRTELEGDRPDVADVLGVLAHERLITIDGDEVEVAHEALLREWPRLRRWLAEDAEGRRLHQHLIHAASDWQAAGREPGELYRGARLAAALDWLAEHAEEPNALEHEFLLRSRLQAASEGDRQRRANRRLRVLLGGLVALLALTVGAGLVALAQRGEARRAALTADAERLGAEARTREHLDHALLLARAGVALDDSAVTRGNLLSVLTVDPLALGVLPGDGRQLWSAAVSPDGRLVAVAGGAGVVTFVDAATREPIGRPYRLREGIVQRLQFSPDSRTLAVAGLDRGVPVTSGMVDLVDTRTHRRRLRIVPPPFPEPAQWSDPDVVFAPDGRDVILTQIHEGPNVKGPPSLLRRFDGVTGAPDGPPLRVGRHAAIRTSGTGDRRRLLLTSETDDATYVVGAEPLRVVDWWPVGDFVGAVSADGRMFALGSRRGTVRALDLRSGRVRRFAGGHDGSVQSMRFTRDGRTLATAGADGQVLLWDVAGGAVREVLAGHAQGQMWGIDVSPDGGALVSVGEDKRAFVWDLRGDQGLLRTFAARRPFVPDDGDLLPRGLALGADGRTLLVGHSDGTVDLVDAGTLRLRHRFRALRGFVAAIAASEDGRWLAVAGQHGQVTLWDAKTLRPAGNVPGFHTTIQTVAFSSDGRHLAAAELGEPPETGDTAQESTGANVRVWDVRERRFTAVRSRLSSASIALGPSGRVLAVANAEGTLSEILDVRTGRLLARLRTPDDTRSLAFSRDGRLLATGHYDGTAQLWSTKTWRPTARRIEGHDGKRFLWMEFSPDGTVLATTGQDGTAMLFDVATQNPIGSPQTIEPDSFLAADLSADGSHLFVASEQRRAIRWNVSPEAWNAHACRVAGRELTREEWDDALPNRSYRRLCRSG